MRTSKLIAKFIEEAQEEKKRQLEESGSCDADIALLLSGLYLIRGGVAGKRGRELSEKFLAISVEMLQKSTKEKHNLLAKLN